MYRFDQKARLNLTRLAIFIKADIPGFVSFILNAWDENTPGQLPPPPFEVGGSGIA